MSLREVAIGELLRIKHGYAFKGEHFADHGPGIVVTPGNFHETGGFRRRTGKDRFYTGDFPEAFILNAGDLIIAMTEQGEGLLGSSAVVPDSEQFLHNQRIGLVHSIDIERADKNFLFYLFNTKAIRAQIRASASGTKVRHTAPERIYRVRAMIPALSAQQRIASILSAYDTLIENNRRRIALLEEAARQLYKEWFVRFRFPGHEHVKIVDRVPEGWERVALGSVCKTNVHSFSASELPDHIRYVDIAAVERGEINAKELISSREAPGRARRIASHGDVIWSNVRPNLRAYALVMHPNEYDVFSTGFTVLSSTSLPHSYLYMLTTDAPFVDYLVNQTTGASYPAVRSGDFERAEIVLPRVKVLTAFQELCAPNFGLAYRLRQQNQQLARARDLLLPKLMSGTIAV